MKCRRSLSFNFKNPSWFDFQANKKVTIIRREWNWAKVPSKKTFKAIGIQSTSSTSPTLKQARLAKKLHRDPKKNISQQPESSIFWTCNFLLSRFKDFLARQHIFRLQNGYPMKGGEVPQGDETMIALLKLLELALLFAKHSKIAQVHSRFMKLRWMQWSSGTRLKLPPPWFRKAQRRINSSKKCRTCIKTKKINWEIYCSF